MKYYHSAIFKAKVLTLFVTIALLAPSKRSFAEDIENPAIRQQVQFLLTVIKKNYGRTFCAPSTTKLKDVIETVRSDIASHPELQGGYTEDQIVQVLSRKYPCAK